MNWVNLYNLSHLIIHSEKRTAKAGKYCKFAHAHHRFWSIITMKVTLHSINIEFSTVAENT